MKNLLFITITLLFLSACGQSPEEKQKQKLNDFLSNFKELEFPVESIDGQIPSESALTEIDDNLLDLFTDTTGGFSEYGGIRHFGIRYAYVGKISLPEKPFDILFMYNEHDMGIAGYPINYTLYTFSKNGGVIDSIPFAYTLLHSDQYKFFSDGEMNKNLEFETTDWEKEWDDVNGDEPDDFSKGKTKKYKINDDGTIILIETILPEKKGVDPEIVLAFLEQFELDYLPCILENVKITSILKLKGFDFLKNTFPFDILYQDFDKNMENEELPRPVLKFYPQKNYHTFIVYFWENGDVYNLYTISKTGEIIDEMTVSESYGTDVETIDSKTSFVNHADMIEFTMVKSHYLNNREKNIETINETINKYKIDENGKIVNLSKDSLHSQYYAYDKIPDNFYLSNDGIGSIKLGQDIHKIKNRVSAMITGALWVNEYEGEFFAIYNENLEFMFNLSHNTIYKITVNAKYKTEKGIGVGSTYLELKTAYTDVIAELEETEGDPYIVLKIKSMPNFEMLIDFHLSEDSNQLKSDEILAKILDTAKITKMSISDAKYY